MERVAEELDAEADRVASDARADREAMVEALDQVTADRDRAEGDLRRALADRDKARKDLDRYAEALAAKVGELQALRGEVRAILESRKEYARQRSAYLEAKHRRRDGRASSPPETATDTFATPPGSGEDAPGVIAVPAFRRADQARPANIVSG